MSEFILEAPCARCVHIKVCALKPLLEIQAQKVEHGQPIYDPDFTVRLTVEVDCAHFLPAAVREITAAAVGIPLEPTVDVQPKDSVLATPWVDPSARADDVTLSVDATEEPVLLREEPSVATAVVPAADERVDFNARAKAKLEASWRSTHQVDEAPPAGDPLTHHQRRVLETLVRLEGDRKTTAVQLKTTVAHVEITIETVAKKGLLPVELIEKLPARFAKYATVPA